MWFTMEHAGEKVKKFSRADTLRQEDFCTMMAQSL